MRWLHKLVGVALGLGALCAIVYAVFLAGCWGWWWESKDSLSSWILSCQCSHSSEQVRIQLRYGTDAFALTSGCIPLWEKETTLTNLLQDGFSGSWWVTENLSLILNDSSNPAKYTLLQIKDGRPIPLRQLSVLPEDTLDPQTLQILTSAEKIIALNNLIIVLPKEFDSAPTFAWLLVDQKNKPVSSGILRANYIAYTEPQKQALFSKNRKFYYENDTMYLTATNSPIMHLTNDANKYLRQGWLKDDIGAILVYSAPFDYDIPPHPILLAQVPREYLAPEQQRAFDARQQELEQIRGEGNRQVWWALGLALLLTGATVVWWLYWGWFKRRASRTF